MNITHHLCDWQNCEPFFISSDSDQADRYSELTQSRSIPENPLQYVLSALGANGVLIDIGANVGTFTLSAAAAGARVLAVEALAHNYVLLVDAIVANKFTHVTAVHAAAFSKSDLLFMMGSSAWGQISNTGTGQLVPALRLDDLHRAYAFSDAGVLKMDVEGAQLSVIEGGQEFLKSAASLRIVFEVNPWASAGFGYGHEELLGRFEHLGYQLYLICGSVLVPRTSADFQEAVLSDYEAVKDSRLASVPGFSVRPLTLSERVELTLAQLRAPNPELRAFVLATAARMPAEMAADPDIRAALTTVETDTGADFLTALARLQTIYQ